MKIGLIFPHQLFEELGHFNGCNKIYLIEEYLYFKQYPFHKQKIAFQRASMKNYESYLLQQNIEVQYVEAMSELSDIRQLLKWLKQNNNISEICYSHTNDNWLEQRIQSCCLKFDFKTQVHASKLFISNANDFNEFASSKKKLLQNDYYIINRKRLNILIENGQPVGGKWSYDDENRLKYPAGKKSPKTFIGNEISTLTEAYVYTEKNFSHHLGKLDVRFQYPVNFIEAKQWYQRFLNERFNEFGTYEDAIVAEEYCLHHSLLSPLLNTGLLTVAYVIDEAILHAKKHLIALNQLEGFIRQIIGWREFIRGVYEWKGVTQRNSNFFNHHLPMPSAFYDAITGIPPIDQSIQKLLNSGYNHHIERLMVLSNFMLLCEISPNAIYKWFMEMYIDAYDWVMVPNVYGMGQFADGGMMCTKPYISSSNYILKMSNYRKGPWTDVWDALFWRFMNKHREYLSKNFRLSMLIKTYDKMNEEKKKNLHDTAEKFLTQLHGLKQNPQTFV